MKVSGGTWVLANLHISGYYRVNYDLSNWERLISQLSSNHRVRTPVGTVQRQPTHTMDVDELHLCLFLSNEFVSMWDSGQSYGLIPMCGL